MSIQSKLVEFCDKIKLDFDTKEELREKREILIKKLEASEELPSFEAINQGSYAMYTGIEPEKDQEYDIDVALIFSVNKDDYEPMELKYKVNEILENHTDYGAKIKKPCVTVSYKKDGEVAYHVDLVIYSHEEKNDEQSQLYIAKGKNSDEQEWEEADPKGLVEYVNNTINKGKGREQFRRIVRYLKKWKNVKFTTAGHENPPSIGITLMAIDNFVYIENDDLESLKCVVEAMCNKFVVNGTDTNGQSLYRVTLPLPSILRFKENNDIFEKMSDRQMTNFKEKLELLLDRLNAVKGEIDEQEQYKILNKIFGDDFTVPKEECSAKKQSFFIPPSSASGRM